MVALRRENTNLRKRNDALQKRNDELERRMAAVLERLLQNSDGADNEGGSDEEIEDQK